MAFTSVIITVYYKMLHPLPLSEPNLLVALFDLTMKVTSGEF